MPKTRYLKVKEEKEKERKGDISRDNIMTLVITGK
jgi:hypothetical protein